MYKIVLLLMIAVSSAFPKESAKAVNQQPYLYLIQQTLNDQAAAQQIQKDQKINVPLQNQQVYPSNGYGGIQYLDPQFQYPGYNQQAFPRIQPSILLYGDGGQGQPILINPGSPPGNFLVPQQPGTNIFLRRNPQMPPVFVGGYPNPKPAHIPPIEKDAEEIPTNPSNIPPLPSSNPRDKKPEKIETFDEDKREQNSKIPTETEVLAAADKYPQSVTRNNLKPGQRFFILNGEPLYQNYPLNYPEDSNLGFQQLDQPYQDGQRQDFNVPIPGLFLRNVPNFNQEPNYNTVPVELNQNRVPIQNNQRYTQSFIPQNLPQRENLPELIQLSGQNIPQEESLFRTNFQGNEAGRVPVGQFRFSPPNDAYFPFGDDPENDAIVINANFGDPPAISNQPDIPLPVPKSADPSTAQASPGAIALAGPGGIAGASPRATALAGKGGLAVSSPKATAIAGTKDEEKPEKMNKSKQENEKKPTRKPKN